MVGLTPTGGLRDSHQDVLAIGLTELYSPTTSQLPHLVSQPTSGVATSSRCARLPPAECLEQSSSVVEDLQVDTVQLGVGIAPAPTCGTA